MSMYPAGLYRFWPWTPSGSGSARLWLSLWVRPVPVPVHVVAARLGHADPAITLRVYAHVIRTAEAAAADIFAQAVNAA